MYVSWGRQLSVNHVRTADSRPAVLKKQACCAQGSKSPTSGSSPSPPPGANANANPSSCGAGGLTNCGGANSDPVMYGFAGRSFNFIGEVGKFYNIISTQNMQVTR